MVLPSRSLGMWVDPMGGRPGLPHTEGMKIDGAVDITGAELVIDGGYLAR